MRIPLLTLIAAVALSAFAAADRRAAAQQPPASGVESSASSAPSDEVRQRPEAIVTGDRAEFATKINKGLARWQDAVCPLVTGLPRDMAEYILLRVSEVARAAGAPLAGEKCRHKNLFIIVTKQPAEYLRELDKRHGTEVFGGAAPILINEFIATPRPVRTWSVAVPVRPNDARATLTNPWSQASHLVLNVVWAIQRVYVIVDPTRFKGVTLGQLADYVAMAGLAQIKLDPHLGDDPTILALFDAAPQAASAGLTDWDQAFLKSFYASEQKSVMARSAIAQDMVRAMAP